MTGAGVDLDTLGRAIDPVDTTAQAQAQLGLDGYGRLGELAAWWASVRGDARAPAPRLVRHVGTDLPLPPAARAVESKDDGTDDSTAEVAGALAWGVDAADQAADAGVELLLLTVDDELGARLVAAELMGLDAVEANGWPQDRGVDDEAWMDELLLLRDGLARTSGLRGEPGALLQAIGSPRMAAASALMVQATARHLPILLDGPGAAAAALLARRTAYVANQWWQAAHVGAAPLHARSIASLNLDPLTDLHVDVEDGTAARIGLALLTIAAELLDRPPPPE